MKLITELEGRELDAAVATEVMGCKPIEMGEGMVDITEYQKNVGYACRCADRTDFDPDDMDTWAHTGLHSASQMGRSGVNELAYFSSDICAAWHVVKKLREKRGVEVSIESNGDRWWVDITDGTSGTFDSNGSYDRVLGQAGGDTPGEAICRAALEAVRRV